MRSNCIINPVKEYEKYRYRPQIQIGDDVYVGRYCQIHCIDRIVIGNGVVLSEYVYISDLAHGLNPQGGLIMEQPLESKGPVKIGDNSFIGFGASLLPGVTLGKNCVVGVRSVVNKSFEDGSMIGGVPAQLIKKYNYQSNEWEAV